MTERGATALQRDAAQLRIGPSRLRWDGDELVVELDEITAPWPSRVRGTLRVQASGRTRVVHALDAQARHHWSPIAPSARIEVALERPALRWHGHAYVDSNRGTRPLEADFRRWDWSRGALPDGSGLVFYDVTRRDGSRHGLSLHIGRDGAVEAIAPPPLQPLPRSAWGLAREARADAAEALRVVRGFEDGPFYARALLRTRIRGEAVTAVHETVDLDRFASRWVQALLPFRMPRRG